MIFWILVAIIVGLTFWAFLWNLLDDMPGLGIFMGVVTLAAGVVASSVIIAGIVDHSGERVIVSQNELRAINTGNSVSGSFFLGSGVVDGERVLNYIIKHDGYSTLGQVGADRSRIYEDSGSPHVITTRTELNAWWLSPWTESGFYIYYEFHIPEGSVLESYSIEN